MKSFTSFISNQTHPLSEKVYGRTIRKPIFNLIARDHPGFGEDSMISLDELNIYRHKYLSSFLEQEVGSLSTLERKVLDTIADQESMVGRINTENEGSESTFGEHLADNFARFGGSWKFILIFMGFITVWMAINLILLSGRPFDPYPFILLNLILSCLAALQAPVIMMSQNRQEKKDRDRAKQDYMVNLKAELEIRTLHEKVDHLVLHQQQELLKIQQVQVEMLEDIMKQMPPHSPDPDRRDPAPGKSG